jgi:class 3 adenylate cyclase
LIDTFNQILGGSVTTQESKRKVATILSGDVTRYRRLLARDEAGTIRTLAAYKEVIANLIHRHGGNVVDAPGDHVLAEFSDVMKSVQCAVDIQKELKKRNDELPEPRRMEFRFGIDLGEVSQKEGTIFGEGVNTAVRLQSFADAGGICLSGKVFEQIKNKSELRYDYLGKPAVQNIAEPVRIYRVLREGETVSFGEKCKRVGLFYWKRFQLPITITVALVGAANGIWQLYPRIFPPPAVVAPQATVEIASKTNKAPTLPAPAKVPIASRFDGTWNVVLVCSPQDGALGYTYDFIVHVKNGVLHGLWGTREKAPNLALDGEINPDGNAVIKAKGLTGDQKYIPHNYKSNMPYSYHIDANFAGSRGTGKRIGNRICNLTFVKQ